MSTFAQRLLGELEGAIDRAGDAIEAEAKAAAEPPAGRQERTDGPADPKAGETA